MRLFLEVRARRGLPLTVVMATTVMIGYAGRWREWLGVWSETQQSIGGSLIIGIPVATGIGAWIGAANRRSGLDELRRGSGRPARHVALRELGEPAIWTALGYELGSIPAFVLTDAVASADRPHLLPMLAQLACVVAVTAIGQRVGSRLPWLLGAPVCAVVAYVGLGVLSYQAEPALIALTPLDDRRATFDHTLGWIFGAQAIGWLLVFCHAFLHRAGSRRVALIGLFAAGLAVAPVLLISPETKAPTAGASTMWCRGARDDATCVPVVKKFIAPDIAREAAKAGHALAGLLPEHLAFVDDEAAGTSREADRNLAAAVSRQRQLGRYVVLLSRAGGIDSYTVLDPHQFHYYLIDDLVPSAPGTAVSTGMRKRATPVDVIHRWYLTGVGVPIDGSGGPGAPVLTDDFVDFRGHDRQVEAFEIMTATERARWFVQHLEAISRGTLTWSDLGSPPTP